jgi:enoyl-CoA hydratase/carnithine racemase
MTDARKAQDKAATNDVVTYSVSERIATITLNRPERLNAWDDDMQMQFRKRMRQAADDPEVRVIVWTGAGRAFCAGAEIARLERNQRRMDGIDDLYPFDPEADIEYQTQFGYFPSIPKPIIAAINGPVVGIGFVQAMWSDIRFASDNAVFASIFSQRGLPAEHGTSYLLTMICGHSNAMDILLSGRRFGAQEALEMRVVNKVYASAELMAKTYEYARHLADGCSPYSLKVIKRQVWEAPRHGLRKAVDVSAVEIRKSRMTKDFEEGYRHFVEKRPPRFSGE